MKKSIKKTIIVVLVIVVLILIYKYYFAPRDHFRSINMVPENAFLVVETDNPFKTWNELGNSSIWQHMQKNPFFKEINNEIYSADSLIKENKLLFRLFGSRNVLISIHEVGRDDYATLIVADMKNLSKLKVFKNHLTSLNNDDYIISKRNFEEKEIFEVYDREEKEMIYISFIQNLLVISYNHLLLEESIKQSELPVLSRNQHFIEISNQIQGSGQIRFFLNFKEINKQLSISGEDSQNSLHSFLKLLYFGGLKLDVKDNVFDLSGYLNGADTIPTFINALAGTGKGDDEMISYIPKRAFMYIHVAFGSFNKLISNLEDNLKREGHYDEYQKNIRKIEKLLEINVEDNIFSWIDDEIGILNLKSKYKNTPAEYILILKAKKASKAEENLNYINQQIKKNTPVKFKSIVYKDININYLSATGLFKVFFGRFFSKLDKPYYMVFNNYVYFSNHPQTLKDIIDDVLEENTLFNWNEYNHFIQNNFTGTPNIFVFTNTPILLNEYKNSYLINYKSKIEKNMDFIDQLPFIGIEIDHKKELFYNHLVVQYRDTIVNEQILYQSVQEMPGIFQILNEVTDIKDDTPEYETELSENPFHVDDFAVLDLSKTTHREYYDDEMKNVKYEVEVNGGIKNGEFTWYYENGEVRLKGKYKNDFQTGTWKYYDLNGNLKDRKKFD